MTDCADSTALRAHLDHTDPALEAHLDRCDTCTGLLHSVAADAGYARRALAVLDPVEAPAMTASEVDAALAAALGRGAPAVVIPLSAASGRRRSSAGRRLALAGAAAVVVVVATFTPGGRSAVAQAIDAFRGERLQAVTVDMASFADSFGRDEARALAALGDVDTTDLTEPEEVAGLAEAEALAGIAGPGLTGTPDRFVALAPGRVRLVLDARDGNGVPADLDGAVLLVDVPGAIGAVYGPEDGPPELFVGKAGALVVRSEGAPLEEIRAFVLGREELPETLRTQLAAIRDWRSTIPVPVPVDGPGWRDVQIGGRQAIAFGDDTGLGALVIRQDPGGVTVVGGRIGVSRAIDLAGDA